MAAVPDCKLCKLRGTSKPLPKGFTLKFSGLDRLHRSLPEALQVCTYKNMIPVIVHVTDVTATTAARCRSWTVVIQQEEPVELSVRLPLRRFVPRIAASGTCGATWTTSTWTPWMTSGWPGSRRPWSLVAEVILTGKSRNDCETLWWVPEHAHVGVCMCVYVCLRVYIYVFACACTPLCVCVCVFI